MSVPYCRYKNEVYITCNYRSNVKKYWKDYIIEALKCAQEYRKLSLSNFKTHENMFEQNMMNVVYNI